MHLFLAFVDYEQALVFAFAPFFPQAAIRSYSLHESL